jgi:Spherulation-specific family 4
LEISNLTRLKNVLLVGYIDVNYGSQSVEDVQAQIDQYANLGNTASNLTLDGVYFDQTPSGGSDAESEYLTKITSYAKNSHNFGANFVSHPPLPIWFKVVHNPGTIPARSNLVGQDLTVVFQGSYANYTGDESLQSTLQALPGHDWQDAGRGGYAYIFNGMPANFTASQIKAFIENVFTGAQYLLMTDQIPGQDMMGGFGDDWSLFTQAMSEI